ncbi:MAG TPA: hypothetical protein VFG52_11355 [Xanthomonadales bacterium]|nr:hypothetical protein [Xanthomonadales bacterium]
MNSKLVLVTVVVSCALYVNPAFAHQPGYYGGSQSGISGSVTIWGGSPYGPGYSGTINYGGVYPPPPPYHGAYWYPVCGHWHPKAYRAPRNHAYARGYAHGYADSYHGGKHHGKKGHYKHGKGHHH